MLKGIVVKIYPNNLQVEHIEQNIGNARFVWNQMLNMWNSRYLNNPNLPTLSAYDLHKFLPLMKQEYSFLKVSESTSLQIVCENLQGSFDEFFNNTRKHPKFKAKKTAKASYTMKLNKGNIELADNAIKLPKLGWMKARWSNNINFTKIKRATITRTPSGYYTVSVLVESENQVVDKTEKQVGLDVGQIDLVIGSDGFRVPSKTYSNFENKLKLWQKKMARRQLQAKKNGIKLEEAKNYQKARIMVAKYHEKIRNSRKDYLHKTTNYIVKEYDFIAVEDLKVKSMMENLSVGKNSRANNHKIANQSWHLLRLMLEYKSEWYGKTFVKVDPRYTSQDCSNCYERTGPKGDTSVREWKCSNCQESHDRDINAGKNILRKGLALVS